ncbi:hypothetical protein BKA81DRAFT_369135 [Phyllosticta paracitricarpa]|uniref:UBX domain-containing protein n=1 Tax=Phyllosticta paracitricarpa TaxID=2016321 RepID=A0ABR1MWV1_9PEZI
MFHQGDLQSGISLALQQSKSVTCFVTDESDESRLWEEEWLHDDRIAQLLASKSVNLRLEAGSVEAGFLAAFCPIHKAPALIVVHNGQLRLSLFAGVEKEDFVSQLAAVLGNEGAQKVHQSTPGEAQLQEEARASVTQASPSTPAQTTSPPPSTPYTEPAPTPAESNTSLTALLPDRAARLEAERRREAEAEAAARREKAAGKRRAVEEEANKSSSSSSQMSYAAQEKLRKQAQKSELQRILERVEADKRDRREQAEMRRRLREAEATGSPHPDISEESRTAATTTTTTSSRGPASKSGTVCLRILLLDGTQLRDYFPPTSTLASDVRPRVDAALSSSSSPPPYTFKLLLAPQHPNRHLSASDEAQPLQDIDDVAPSATLILVPVRNAATVSAYTGAGGGYIGSVYVALLATYNLLASFVGTFFAPFARGGGGGANARSSEEQNDSAAAASATSSGRDAGSGSGSGTGMGSGNGSAAKDTIRNRAANSNSPAAAAASSSWSAKHMNAASASTSARSPAGGSNESSGSGLDGQTDNRAAAAAAGAASGSGSGLGSSSASGAGRIRTLRDRMGEDDDERRNEYYNGNSLGFEGDDQHHQGGAGGEGKE